MLAGEHVKRRAGRARGEHVKRRVRGRKTKTYPLDSFVVSDNHVDTESGNEDDDHCIGPPKTATTGPAASRLRCRRRGWDAGGTRPQVLHESRGRDAGERDGQVLHECTRGWDDGGDPCTPTDCEGAGAGLYGEPGKVEQDAKGGVKPGKVEQDAKGGGTRRDADAQIAQADHLQLRMPTRRRRHAAGRALSQRQRAGGYGQGTQGGRVPPPMAIDIEVHDWLVIEVNEDRANPSSRCTRTARTRANPPRSTRGRRDDGLALALPPTEIRLLSFGLAREDLPTAATMKRIRDAQRGEPGGGVREAPR